MTFEAAQFFLSPRGRGITAEARGMTGDALAAGKYLRRSYPDIPVEYLAAALELSRARERARGKFGRAEEMFFTREALEQASGGQVAEHRAERFRGMENVLDVCSGIGGDAIALGKAATRLTCVDTDPARLLFCGENLRIHGIEAVLTREDAVNLRARLGEYDSLFIYPSRRTGGKRTLDARAMSPSLETAEELLRGVPRGAAKLPSSIRTGDISIPHELEWVSLEDGLKEATLWNGEFRRCAASVSLLHKNAFLRDDELPPDEAETGAPGAFLHEPDPALIRSSLLGRKAASLGMRLIDREIAYTFTDAPVRDPFFNTWRTLEIMPFNLKRLKAALHAMGAGIITVKKRGFPLSPEEVIRKLKLKGSGSATVVLTRRGGEHLALIIEATS